MYMHYVSLNFHYFFPERRDPSTKLGFSTFMSYSVSELTVVYTVYLTQPYLNLATVCGRLSVPLYGSWVSPGGGRGSGGDTEPCSLGHMCPW